MAQSRTRKLDIEIGSEAKGVDKGFDKADKQADAFAKKMGVAGEKAGKAISSGVEGETEKLGAKLKKAGDKAGDQFAASLGNAGSTAAGAFSSGFDVEGLADTITDGLGDALGGSGGKLATVAGGLGVAAATAFGVGLFQGFEAEAANDRLAASLGLNEAQAESFGRAAGAVYARGFGESLDDVNVALEAVSSSLGEAVGPAEDALEKTTEKALALSEVFGIDVPEAVGLAGVAIDQGLARDAGHALDLMVATLQQMPLSMRSELIPAIEEYGGFLADLGFTGEQAFGIVAAAAEGGTFQIDKTLDAVKELSIRATDMSTSTTDAFKALGLDAEEMAGRILKGGDSAMAAIQELSLELLAVEDPVERANTAIALFGTPLEDLSVTQIPTFLEGLVSVGDGLGDVSGAADDMTKTLSDNAARKIEAFRRQALQRLTEFVANSVLPKLESLKEWAEENPTAFRIVAAVVGGVLVTAFTAWAISAGAAAVATIAATWPILLLGAAVVGLAALVVVHFDTIKRWISNVFNWVKDNWPLLLAILTGPFGLAVWFIAKHWQTIKDGALAAKDWVVTKFGELVDWAKGLPGKLADAASGLWDWVTSGLSNAVRWVWDHIRSLIRAYNSIPMLPDVPVPGQQKQFGGVLPKSHSGELIPGGPSFETARLLQGGEEVLARDDPRNIRNLGSFTPALAAAGGGGGVSVHIDLRGSTISNEADAERMLVQAWNRAVQKGGARLRQPRNWGR